MTDEVLEAAVKWINANKVRHVHFYGGEPLAFPLGVKTILAKTKAESYGITTNGTLLTKDVYEWLKLFDVQVLLSLDGDATTQNYYRDNSYDKIMKNLPFLLDLNTNVLATMVSPHRLYENIKHIRDLGFRNCFLNLLDPYGYGYSYEQIEVLEEQYLRVVNELHRPPRFSVNDYLKFKKLIEAWKTQPPGCGINRRGYCIGPRGFIYPCHRAVELGEDFAIGSVWNGIDPVRERKIRKEASTLPKKCRSCELKCFPCPVSCYNAHGTFGVDPEDWFCRAMKAKIRAVLKASPKPLVRIKPSQ